MRDAVAKEIDRCLKENDRRRGTGKGLASEYSLDGCHPTKAAYSVMEGIVLPLIEK